MTPGLPASPEPTGGVAPARPGPVAGRSRGRSLPAALLALALVLAIFFSPALLTRGQFVFRDSGRLHHPEKTFIAGELHQGHLPAWNPYMGMGVPLVGTAVDASLHPFNLLLATLPFEIAFKAWILLSVLLGGAGAFLWARDLELGFAPALVSALAFSLSGFLVSSSDNVTYLTAAATLPWLLWAAEAFFRRGGPLRLFGLAAASWVCAAAGDPQGWALAVGVLGLRGLWLARPPGARGRGLGRAALACLAAAVAAAPLLLPVALWMPHSRRAAGLEEFIAQRWNLHPLRLLELFLPGLLESDTWGALAGGAFDAFAGNANTAIPWVTSVYLGVSTLALAALGAAGSGRARALLAAAAVATWAAMGHYAGFVDLVRHLPLLGLFRYWEKLVIWPTLLVAAAAGIGLERLLAEPRRGRPFALLTGGAALLLAAARLATEVLPLPRWLARPGASAEDVLSLIEHLRRATGSTALVLALLAVAALALARGLLTRAAPLAFATLVAFDLASANIRAYVLAPPETVQPGPALTAWLQGRPELPRVVTPFLLTAPRFEGVSPFEASWRWGALTYTYPWNVGVRVGNFDVYTGLNPLRLSRFRMDAKLDRLVPQVGLWGFGFLVVPGRPEMAARMGLAPPFQVAAADAEHKIYLVELPRRPRAYLADEVASVDAAGAEAFAFDPASVGSPRSVVEGPLAAAPGAGPPGSARIARASTDEVVVEVEALRPALLVLNDQVAPGWRARVDGSERPIVTANYLARAVWVDAGRHRIEFAYRTPGLFQGWLAVGALGLALVGWGALRRRRSA